MNTYYRTGAGSHRHADWVCANNLRSIHTGDLGLNATGPAGRMTWPGLPIKGT